MHFSLIPQLDNKLGFTLNTLSKNLLVTKCIINGRKTENLKTNYLKTPTDEGANEGADSPTLCV